MSPPSPGVWCISTAELVLMLPESNASSDGHQPPTPLGRSKRGACGTGGFWVVMFWWRGKSGFVFNKSISDCENIFTNKTEQDSRKTCILSNVNTNHSGWYFCKVTTEIPSLTEIHSNGTEVNVWQTFPPADPPALSDNWWIWVVLGASSFILFILTVTCVLLSRRQENREEPIYANTPNKQPSPRPSMSAAAVSLKAASSFQDPRTPSPASRYDEGKRRYRH
ncbi:uncharacterized protein LOC102192601 [Pundamilia nyererei]|uniref:Uncharacterized protein LOC102192601 n=1 Tax=Pundamilia nyererei TaxID=303518 RepID=A0A9Y6M4N9_9CICH|nr:PREDICTED: uncharacterized protein LOC102192601 [Pundamilia nyererei]